MHLGVKKVFHFKFIKKPLVRDLKDFNLFRLEPSVFQRFNKYLKLSNTIKTKSQFRNSSKLNWYNSRPKFNPKFYSISQIYIPSPF